MYSCFEDNPTLNLQNLGDGICQQGLNIIECAFDFGDCTKKCSKGCNKCYEEDGEIKCLECEENFVQFYNMCLTECISGFIPTVKLGRQVCEPISDISAKDYITIYVTQDRSSLFTQQNGTFDTPYSSLSTTLSLIRNKYTRVYLMNDDDSDHLLDSILIDKFPGTDLGDNSKPLDYKWFRFWDRIEILPLFCSAKVQEKCYRPDQKARIRWVDKKAIQLDIFKNMEVSDIEFDGYNNISSLDCSGFEIYCTYCPYISYDETTNKNFDDKGQEVTWNYASNIDCERYKNATLFNILSGNLRLTNVRFINWRAGFFSLITIHYGKIELFDVDFINIQANSHTYSSIITSYDCDSVYNGCSFLIYEKGRVELLNNGYEYRDDSYYSGFFYGKGMGIATFTDIIFEKNLAYTGKYAVFDNSNNSGALIMLDYFITFRLDSCIFRYNLVDTIATLNVIIHENDRYLYEMYAYYNSNNISVSKNHFHNIFGDILLFNFYKALPKLEFIDNIFENITYKTEMILISSNQYTPYEYNRKIEQQRTYISRCYGPSNLIKLENLKYVSIDSLIIKNSLQNPNNLSYNQLIEESVYQHFKENTYITEPFSSIYLNYTQFHYSNACLFYGLNEFMCNSLVLSDNYSVYGGTDILFLKLEGSFLVGKTDITNNISNSKTSGTGLSFAYTASDLIVSNIRAINNTNSIGYGVIYFENFNTQDHIEFTILNSYFQENSGGFGASMAISASKVVVKDVVFIGNRVTNSFGAGIYFNQHSSTVDSMLIIKNCTFIENIVQAGVGGAIAISNSLKFMKGKLQILIENSLFMNNTSNNDASVIYISNEVQLHSSSLIKNCSFLHNSSNRKANILVAFYSGLLTFNECNFEANEASRGIVMYIQSNQDSATLPTKVIITSSKFIANKPRIDPYASLINVGDSISHSTLETYSSVFRENLSSCVDVSYGTWISNNCTFIDNQATQAAVAKLFYGGKAQIFNNTIENNTSLFRGGAFQLTDKSSLSVSDSIIRRNRSYLDGGVIFMDNQSIIFIYNTDITDNFSYMKGSLIYSSECKNEGSVIENSRIMRNISKKGGIISLINSHLNIKNTEIYSNTDDTITPGIIISFSILSIDSSVFRNQTGEVGSAIYATTENEVYIKDSIFEDLRSLGSGGIIFGYYSYINITSSRFKNLYGVTAGSILAYSDCILEIYDCVFENSRASSGGVIKIFDSQLIIRDSEFYQYNATGIQAENLSVFEISDSIFQDGSGEKGGALSCISCEKLHIYNSDFYDNSGIYGGAIYVTSTRSALYRLSGNSFIGNFARVGGSIYLDNLSLLLYKNTFQFNEAVSLDNMTDGVGGAVKIECSTSDSCVFNITENTFDSNFASREGGSISWKHFSPMLEGNTFLNNSAIYGNDISSFPTYIMIYETDQTFLLSFKSIYSIEAAPGQRAPPIQIALLDTHYQLVSTDSYSIAEMTPNNSSITITGEIKTKANNGYFRFDNYILLGKPNSTEYISIQVTEGIQSSNIRSEYLYINKQVNIEVYLRECLAGEKESDNKCNPCPVETYSLVPKEGSCNRCPEEAVCYGGSLIVPKNGYWRDSNHTDIIFRCPNEKACLGASSIDDLILSEECREGYTGNLCDTCDRFYYKAGFNTCEKCLNEAENVMKLIGILLLVFTVLTLLIKSTFQSVYKPKSLHSIYLKILLNHFQLAVLTINLAFNWPRMTEEFLSFQKDAGSLSEQISNIDCLLYDNYDNVSLSDIYFIKIICMALLPLFQICIALIIWGSIALYKQTTKIISQEFVSSVIILLFVTHPILVKFLFSSISCKELEPGEYWVRDHTSIRCWDNEHSFYFYSFVLPGILIWGILAPTLCFIILLRNRRHLTDIKFRFRFGYLFNGYSKKYYYWEFIILYRKILIIFCSTFLSAISTRFQALSISILLIITFYIHQKSNPFVDLSMNEMEKRSILVSTVTIYCGLYYINQEIDSASRFLVFGIILAVNLYFICYWVYKVLQASEKMIRKIPCCKHILPKRPNDRYPEELFVSKKYKNPHRKSKRALDINVMATEPDNISEVHSYNMSESVGLKNLKRIEEMKSVYLLVARCKNAISNAQESPPVNTYSSFSSLVQKYPN